MKTRLYIFALLIVACDGMGMNAQTFAEPADNNAIQSHQIMSTGSNYNGTVYAPFDNTVPSEQSTVGASYSPAKAPGGPRRMEGFDTAADYGRADESPLGDGLLPLLMMAATFCGVIAFRRKKGAGVE